MAINSTLVLFSFLLLNCHSGKTVNKNQDAIIRVRADQSLTEPAFFPYNLAQPNLKLQLPDILNEVSGLTDIDSAHVACVQDEIGTVFIYNFRADSIVNKLKFDSYGDFEGLTLTENALFILRSDGRLTEWTYFSPADGGKTINHTMLPLLTSNNEGLCYDPEMDRLLIAAKNKPLNHDYKYERYIYEYDLSKRMLNPNPVYSIHLEDLERAAKKFNVLSSQSSLLLTKAKQFNFRPASLAVHPLTSDIYIISASDRMLMVIDRSGNIRHIELLSHSLFAKAEGITFLKDGTMIITNEAADIVPTLLVYSPLN